MNTVVNRAVDRGVDSAANGLKKTKAPRLSSQHWAGKASAGLILGFCLSLGLSGFLGLFVFGGVGQFSIAHQLTMWFMAPTLVVLLSTCFLFQSGLRAWCWLGAANVVVWSILFLTS